MSKYLNYNNNSRSQSGSVATLLLASVGVTAVLMTTVYGLMTGPIRAAAIISNKSKSQSEMVLNAKVLMRSAIDDADGVKLPPPFDPAANPKPVGGGGIIAAANIVQNDAWGTPYGYCAWDHGTATAAVNRLAGSATYNDKLTLVIISAGPDRIFQSSCAGDPAYLTQAGDDYVQSYTFEDAVAAGGGVWTKDTADPNTIRYGGAGAGVLIGAASTTLTGDDFQVKGNAFIDGAVDIKGALTLKGSIQNTPIGNVTPQTGAFDAVTAVTGLIASAVFSNASIDRIDIGVSNGSLFTKLNSEYLNGLTGPEYLRATSLNAGNFSSGEIASFSGDVANTGNGYVTSVVGLNTRPVLAGAPATRNILRWNGAAWAPAALTLSGDVTGDATTATVSRIHGRNVASTLPNTYDVLGWDAGTSTWRPMTLVAGTGTPGVSVGVGGVNFLATSPNITSGSCVAGETVKYDGTNWNCDPDNIGGTIPIPFDVTSATNQQIMTMGGSNYMTYKGTLNLIMGNNAGNALQASATPGNRNIGLGGAALANLTTGQYNFAIGFGALNTSPTASFNLGIGRDVLQSVTSGVLNTGVGNGALQFLTTGNNNIGIGNRPLWYHTTVSNNTVVGNESLLSVTGANSANNSVLGSNALYYGLSGSDNIAVGYQALFGRIPCPGNCQTGSDNIAIGTESLYTNNSGSRNIAVGYRSMQVNTTGSQNIAIGAESLDVNTTGNSNLAVGHGSFGGTAATSSLNIGIGHQALTNANNTQYNIGIGRGALFGNGPLSGAYNIALGSSALANTTTGSSNIAIGTQAGISITTGTNNVAIGNRAVRSTIFGFDTTSSANVAIGHDALSQLRTGGSNTAIGIGALRNNTTGSNNVAIGQLSSEGPPNPTFHTASRNTTIGFQAARSNSSGFDTTVIGRNAFFNNAVAASSVGIGNSVSSNTGSVTGLTLVGHRAGARQQGASHSTAIGYLALENAAGSNNMGIGMQAAQFNAASTTAATDNIGIGHRPLASVTTGGFNVAIGLQAAFALTTANNNFAMGANAFANPNTASNNVAIGEEALFGNTFSAYADNVALGHYALRSPTSGNMIRNTAIGQNAMMDASGTAQNNTAIGINALRATSSNQNVAVGNESMFTATVTGTDNVAVGFSSLRNVSTGSFNVVVGTRAMQSNTTGSYNVAIGHQALMNMTAAGTTANIVIGTDTGSSITSGIRNILIGDGRNPPTPSTNSYLNIGNTANGSVFYGDMITGNMTLKGTITAPSDGRYKYDIKNLDIALDDVFNIRGVTYMWKKKYKEDSRRYIGFIAQEIQKYLPQLVIKTEHPWDKSDSMLTVSYGQSFPVLVEIMKKQDIKIRDLNEQIAELEKIIQHAEMSHE